MYIANPIYDVVFKYLIAQQQTALAEQQKLIDELQRRLQQLEDS